MLKTESNVQYTPPRRRRHGQVAMIAASVLAWAATAASGQVSNMLAPAPRGGSGVYAYFMPLSGQPGAMGSPYARSDGSPSGQDGMPSDGTGDCPDSDDCADSQGAINVDAKTDYTDPMNPGQQQRVQGELQNVGHNTWEGEVRVTETDHDAMDPDTGAPLGTRMLFRIRYQPSNSKYYRQISEWNDTNQEFDPPGTETAMDNTAGVVGCGDDSCIKAQNDPAHALHSRALCLAYVLRVCMNGLFSSGPTCEQTTFTLSPMGQSDDAGEAAGGCQGGACEGEHEGGNTVAEVTDDNDAEIDINLGSNVPGEHAGILRFGLPGGVLPDGGSGSYGGFVSGDVVRSLVAFRGPATVSTTSDANGLTQVVTDDFSWAKIDTVTTGFEITFRHEGEAAGATPYRTITVTSTADNTFSVVEDAGSNNKRRHSYTYSPTTAQWTVEREQWDTTSSSYETVSTQRTTAEEDGTTGQRVVTHEILDDSGTPQVIQKQERWYETFDDGVDRLVKWVMDPDGAELTRTWTYYDGTTGADWATYGRMESYTNELGFWEHYVYNDDLQLSEIIRQTGSSTYSPGNLATLRNNNLSITYETLEVDLDPGGGTTDGYAVKTQFLVGTGSAQTVSQTTYTVRWPGPSIQPGEQVEWEVTPEAADPASGTTDEAFIQGLISDYETSDDLADIEDAIVVATTYLIDSTSDHHGEVKRVDYMDGTFMAYTYNSSSTEVVSGGTTNQVKVVTEEDADERVERVVRYRSTDGGTSWFIESLVAYDRTTDEFARVTGTEYFFGATAKLEEATAGSQTPAYDTATAYGCCGVTSRTDRYGLTTTYLYDGFGRQTNVTGPDGVGISTEYDEAGRVEEMIRTAGGSSTTLSRTVSDAADRITRITTFPDVSGSAIDTFYTHGTSTTGGYWEVRRYPHDEDETTAGPVQVAWVDSRGDTVRSWTASGAGTWNASSLPTALVTLTELERMDYVYDDRGRMTESRAFHTLPGITSAGTAGTHYDTATTAYDAMGRAYLQTAPSGDVSLTQYDLAGRPAAAWAGTDATGATNDTPTGSGSNDLVPVSLTTFRDDGQVLTQSRLTPGATAPYITSGTPDDADWLVTTYETAYVLGGTDTYLLSSARWVKPEADDNTSIESLPWSKRTYNEQGRMTRSATYANGTTTGASSLSTVVYDTDGRVSAQRVHDVDAGNPETAYIETTMAYDADGRRVRSTQPSGASTFTVYDDEGRVEATLVCSSDNATPLTVTDDTVVTETVYTYDNADRVLQVTTYERKHNAAATAGRLSANTSLARIQHAAMWYDDAGRAYVTAAYGDNGGSAFTRPGTAPSPNSSDDVLVSKTVFDDAGRVDQSIDNLGIVTAYTYDAMGRRLSMIENYTDGDPDTGDEDEDRVTTSVYNAAGQVTQLTADLSGTTDDQTTHYVYSGELSDPTDAGPVPSNTLLAAVLYPDAAEDGVSRQDTIDTLDGSASDTDFVTTIYTATGQVEQRTDQRRVELTFDYDNAGRQTSQRVSADPASALPTSDMRIAMAYTSRGQVDTVTTYSDAAGTTLTSQVKYTYDGYGRPEEEFQDHDSAVVTSGGSATPHVAYAYDTEANGGRLTTITYPNGSTALTYGYGTSGGIDDALSRPVTIKDGSTTLAEYTYTGGGLLVEKDVAGTLTQSRYDSTNGYVGYDRFNRLVEDSWFNPASPSVAVLRYQMGYNRISRPVYTDRLDDADYSELYGHDGLHRLVSYDRGDLNTARTAVDTLKFAQAWDMNPVNSILAFYEDQDGGTADSDPWDLDQDRTFNDVNEIDSIDSTFDGGAGAFVQDTTSPYRVVIEAENYYSVTAGTSDTWQLREFADPAEDYIESLTVNNWTPPGATGIATYTFSVPTAGDYIVWGRMITQQTSDDSFWIRIPTGTPSGSDVTGGWARWTTPLFGEWEWDDANLSSGTGVTWTLAAGTHTLEIGIRENGSKLDAISITPVNVGPGGSGSIDLEAEDADTLGSDWSVRTVSPTDASGDKAMHAGPDDGDSYTSSYTTTSPRLDYKIDFTQTGTYYVWVRGRTPRGANHTNGDTVHVGLNGSTVATAEQILGWGTAATWEWKRSRPSSQLATISITTTGEHTLNVWAREDGFTIDKIVLTQDVNDIITGSGPSESSQSGGTGSEWAAVAYDAAGNMTQFGDANQPDRVKNATYDAWNRLIEVTDAINDDAATYRYDGLNRRIEREYDHDGSYTVIKHDYYHGWSLIESRNLVDAVERQVLWGLEYIDELLLVANNDDGFDIASTGTYAAAHGDRYSVHALVQTSDDAIAERYEYTPYGQRTVLVPDGSGGWTQQDDSQAVSGATDLPLNPFGFQGGHVSRFGITSSNSRQGECLRSLSISISRSFGAGFARINTYASIFPDPAVLFGIFAQLDTDEGETPVPIILYPRIRRSPRGHVDRAEWAAYNFLHPDRTWHFQGRLKTVEIEGRVFRQQSIDSIDDANRVLCKFSSRNCIEEVQIVGHAGDAVGEEGVDPQVSGIIFGSMHAPEVTGIGARGPVNGEEFGILGVERAFQNVDFCDSGCTIKFLACNIAVNNRSAAIAQAVADYTGCRVLAPPCMVIPSDDQTEPGFSLEFPDEDWTEFLPND